MTEPNGLVNKNLKTLRLNSALIKVLKEFARKYVPRPGGELKQQDRPANIKISGQSFPNYYESDSPRWDDTKSENYQPTNRPSD